MKNAISLELSKKLLRNERRGILSINGNNGYPYSIPINYLYSEVDNRIYFHGSKIGQKIDLLKKDNKICFTVYGNETIKDEAWAPYVSSVMVFGKCNFVDDKDRSIELLEKFASKYYPDKESIKKEVDVFGKVTQMFEIEIEQITGKEIQEK